MQNLVTPRIPVRINPRFERQGVTPLWLRVLNAIADWDARKRQEIKLKSLPQYRLDDMGLSAADVERAFER